MLWKKCLVFFPSLLSKNSCVLCQAALSVSLNYLLPFLINNPPHHFLRRIVWVFFLFLEGGPDLVVFFFSPWLLTFSDRLLTDRTARLTRQSHLGEESDTGPMRLCWFSVFSAYKQLYPFAPVHPRDLSLTARHRLDQRACHTRPSLPPKCQITAWCSVYLPITAQVSHFSEPFTW